MIYREYLSAASRHLTTCQLMMMELKKIQKSKKQESKSLKLDIYYISGYIIETLISYSFFASINWKSDIEDSPLYNKSFKQHKIMNKLNFVLKYSCSFPGVILLDTKPKNSLMLKMMNEWSEVIRYQDPKKICKDLAFTVDDLEKYIGLIKNMKNEITKIYFP